MVCYIRSDKSVFEVPRHHLSIGPSITNPARETVSMIDIISAFIDLPKLNQKDMKFKEVNNGKNNNTI